MNKKTGVTVPLAALYTKDCPAVGDFLALKPFADFCEKAGLEVIQLLPVNDSGTHSSPYSGLSAFALHPMYIRIEALPEFQDALENDRTFSAAYKKFNKAFKYSRRFNYEELTTEKIALLHHLYGRIEKLIQGKTTKTKSNVVNTVTAVNNQKLTYSDQFLVDTEHFVQANPWVVEYAVFKNLKDAANQASWKSWEEDLAHMSKEDIQLRWNNKALKSSHRFFVWCQMRAAEQFKEAADYVRSKNISLKGDIPILMNEDSADCWTYPEYFNQELRAGSPPDGENPMGQNWGFPTYNWKNLSADNYDWWKNRIHCAGQYYDAFRIDHILGFFRIWASGEKESTAYLGYTVPYSSFTEQDFYSLGFDEGKLNWLSKPHIPTGEIENITWNHDEAVAVLNELCDRIGNEELWNFKPEVKSDSDIYAKHFFDDNNKDWAVKNALVVKWRDRAIIRINENELLPVYTYFESTAWKSLNDSEKNTLKELFDSTKQKENQIWKQQALDVLTPIVQETSMVPCAEDLGVSLECMPEVLKELNILSLKVIRWTRDWSAPNQPFNAFESYPEMSVATTSVHDSSTLREWWNQEKSAVWAFINQSGNGEGENYIDGNADMGPKEAEYFLKSAAKVNSAWYVNPLQDYLFLDQSYYLENAQEERINVPGSVNNFNWTYRIPVLLEDLSKNESLLGKIKEISEIHKNGGR